MTKCLYLHVPGCLFGRLIRRCLQYAKSLRDFARGRRLPGRITGTPRKEEGAGGPADVTLL